MYLPNRNYIEKKIFYLPETISVAESVTSNAAPEWIFNKKRLVQTLFDLIIIIIVFVIYGLVFLMDPKIL